MLPNPNRGREHHPAVQAQNYHHHALDPLLDDQQPAPRGGEPPYHRRARREKLLEVGPDPVIPRDVPEPQANVNGLDQLRRAHHQALRPIQPAPVYANNPVLDQIVYNQGPEHLPAAPPHQPAHQLAGDPPPYPGEEAGAPGNEPFNLFAGLHAPNPVPNGLPGLQPGPLLDLVDLCHLQPGLIPGLSHRQRQRLTEELLVQGEDRLGRNMLLVQAANELDVLRYRAHLLQTLADRDEMDPEEIRAEEIIRDW